MAESAKWGPTGGPIHFLFKIAQLDPQTARFDLKNEHRARPGVGCVHYECESDIGSRWG